MGEALGAVVGSLVVLELDRCDFGADPLLGEVDQLHGPVDAASS